jgi:hypothetical protein
MFTGDNRDSEAPPITLQNFHSETFRYGAKALRARLSRLSRAELWRELEASAAHVEALEKYKEEILAQFDRAERESAARERSQQQAERGRKHSLQPAILAAARYYRNLGKTAKQAWLAINQTPYVSNGETVVIADDDTMYVRSRKRKQERNAIKFHQWQNSYWRAAKPAKTHAKPG